MTRLIRRTLSVLIALSAGFDAAAQPAADDPEPATHTDSAAVDPADMDRWMAGEPTMPAGMNQEELLAWSEADRRRRSGAHFIAASLVAMPLGVVTLAVSADPSSTATNLAVAGWGIGGVVLLTKGATMQGSASSEQLEMLELIRDRQEVERNASELTDEPVGALERPVALPTVSRKELRKPSPPSQFTLTDTEVAAWQATVPKLRTSRALTATGVTVFAVGAVGAGVSSFVYVLCAFGGGSGCEVPLVITGGVAVAGCIGAVGGGAWTQSLLNERGEILYPHSSALTRSRRLHASIVPSMGPTGGGLTVAGRF